MRREKRTGLADLRWSGRGRRRGTCGSDIRGAGAEGRRACWPDTPLVSDPSSERRPSCRGPSPTSAASCHIPSLSLSLTSDWGVSRGKVMDRALNLNQFLLIRAPRQLVDRLIHLPNRPGPDQLSRSSSSYILII